MSIDDRRSFLTHLTGLAAAGRAALATAPPRGHLQDAQGQRDARDLAWLDSFKGTHKHVYDVGWPTYRPNTMNPPANYLDVHKDRSKLEFPNVNVVVGTNDIALPTADALWSTHKFGERKNVTDPDTGRPATRNVYLRAIKALQARGAVFWMCDMAMRSVSTTMGQELGRPAGDVYAELVAGLLPGVKIVPAHTWAIATLQAQGFTYQKL